jgi:ABC-type transport system substrate-binding protein
LAQSQWRKNSQNVVQPELKLFENVPQIARLSNAEFEVTGPAVRSSYLDPGPLLQSVYRTGGAQNFGRWSDPRADAMIDKQGTIFDVAERKAAVKQLLMYLIENAPDSQFAARSGPSAAKPFVRDYAAGQLVEPFFQHEYIWLDV